MSVRVRPFDTKSPYDDDGKAKIPHHADDEEGDGTTTQNPLGWFGTQFGRWLANEVLLIPQILYWDYQFQFVQVAQEMDSLDILGDGQNCLCHFDLAARNVMVQNLSNGSMTISGIVDWDSAAFAAKFVSCAPPS